MGPVLLALWMATAPSVPQTGVVLLSRRGWQEQEGRFVESLRIYTRDLDLRIETDLLPHEATTPDEQRRAAEARCGAQVAAAMIVWFAAGREGPGSLVTLRCQPREQKTLPLLPGQNADLTAHSLALKLRTLLARPPVRTDAPESATLRAPAHVESPGAAEGSATGAASPVRADPGRARPLSGTPRTPNTASSAPSAPASAVPGAVAASTAAPPTFASAGPSVSGGSPLGSSAPTGSLPAAASPPLAVAARGPAYPEGAPVRGPSLGVRWLGQLGTGRGASGQGLGGHVAVPWRDASLELGASYRALLDRTGRDEGGLPVDLSWSEASFHVAASWGWSASAWTFEGGMQVGAERFTVSALGMMGGRSGVEHAWSASLGLRGLLRRHLGRHFAVEGLLVGDTVMPQRRFTLDGVTSADTGLLRGQLGAGVAFFL